MTIPEQIQELQDEAVLLYQQGRHIEAEEVDKQVQELIDLLEHGLCAECAEMEGNNDIK